MKKIVILGATGSIGENTLRVVGKHRTELEILAIAAKSNWKKLAEISKKFSVKNVAIFDETAANEAKNSGEFPAGTRFFAGLDGICEISQLPEAKIVVSAIVGTLGLKPTLAAIDAKKDVAVASKEILVLAGNVVMKRARERGVKILPIDSEHNAIFQCLGNEPAKSVESLILTASGGAFRDLTLAEMKNVVPEDALKNPNWKMGPKVTFYFAMMAILFCDMMEATCLFGFPEAIIEIVIHPQSVVHSLVKFVDGSVLAQLSPPSMTFPIQNCLLFPRRISGTTASLDFSKTLSLNFFAPDFEKYKCLKLAKTCARAGGNAPIIFNAANEIAVEAFLTRKISFLEIPEIVEKTLQKISPSVPENLEEILSEDFAARKFAAALIPL